MTSFLFRPKILDSLRGYKSADLFRDIMAGLTVGIVALPLAMAFGIASGVDPAAGIFTAIVAGFLISALGGSKVQIGGPTGAFVGLVFATVTEFHYSGLVVCTIMAGVMLVIMGLLKGGSIIKFIPYPVTMGFTSGIAVIIFASQIGDVMGLSVKMPPDFLEKMHVIGGHLKEIQWPTFAIGIGTLALIRLWPTKINRFFPGSFAALIVFTLIALLWAKFGSVEFVTIGSKFGGIPSRLPSPHLPEIDWSQFKALLTPAFKIAMLAAIESLLCAVVSDGMIGDRHYSNTELVAQGIANIGSGLMGGIPATAAIARTATNVRSGGATPIAGIVHALVLLLIIMVAAPLASSVPLAVLGGVLFNTAINMGEWHTFRRLTRWPRSDATIFIVTFLLTVIFDLVVAVEFGMVLAAISLIKRISETTAVSDTAIQPIDDSPAPITDDVVLPPGVMAYRIIGTFFFGAADMLETALRRAGMLPKVLIIRLSRVNALDVSGINALEDLQEKLKRHGGQMVLSGPHSQPLEALQKAGFIESIGSRNVCSNFKEAVARSAELVAS